MLNPPEIHVPHFRARDLEVYKTYEIEPRTGRITARFTETVVSPPRLGDNPCSCVERPDQITIA